MQIGVVVGEIVLDEIEIDEGGVSLGTMEGAGGFSELRKSQIVR